MFGFFKKIFGQSSAEYAAQKKKMTSESVNVRRKLAAQENANPEILFYLAKDKDAKVRSAVATNAATPVQASALLAHDKSTDVRIALAARLVALLPDLETDEHSQLYAYTVQALGVLAEDEVFKVRKALSSALKDSSAAPPKVAGQLARDVEREVSEPILRFCVGLADDDLLDILSGHPEPWVISAIASREEVSETVTDAVVETEDIPANTILISNSGATFTEDTLKTIIDRAQEFPEWHAPLAVRSELSLDLARQLSGFVSESVLNVLQSRADFDDQTSQDVAEMVQRRLTYQKKGETLKDKLKRYVGGGTLTPDVIHDAAVWGDGDFVIAALAFLAKVHPGIAKKMLESGSARPIIALCYRAGMPMRLALALQTDFAKLKPSDIIYAKGGTDYPLSEEDITWQLEFYGVEG